MSLMKKKDAQNNKKVYLLTDKLSFAAQEAYRALRTNIAFVLPGEGCKCIGVTSATPHEGKSTTAANLAISLGQIGKRVMLVDCDMRLPTMASKFRMHGTPGLSDFLVGQARIDDVLRKSDKFNIHLLPAGSIPPEPTALLESRQLERLFTAFRNNYDYIIVDLPPVITVPDAAILAKLLDGYLLVVREKQTEHRAVKEMLRHLQVVGANILGFVVVDSAIGGGKYKYKYKGKDNYRYRYGYYRYAGSQSQQNQQKK